MVWLWQTGTPSFPCFFSLLCCVSFNISESFSLSLIIIIESFLRTARSCHLPLTIRVSISCPFVCMCLLCGCVCHSVHVFWNLCVRLCICLRAILESCLSICDRLMWHTPTWNKIYWLGCCTFRFMIRNCLEALCTVCSTRIFPLESTSHTKHTHTHTYIHTHTHIHKHTHTFTHAHTRSSAHPHIQGHTRTNTHESGARARTHIS